MSDVDSRRRERAALIGMVSAEEQLRALWREGDVATFCPELSTRMTSSGWTPRLMLRELLEAMRQAGYRVEPLPPFILCVDAIDWLHMEEDYGDWRNPSNIPVWERLLKVRDLIAVEPVEERPEGCWGSWWLVGRRV